MIKYEKMNPGLEGFTHDSYNKVAYFSRRNRWATPFIVLGAIIFAICGGNPNSCFKESLKYVPEDKRHNKLYMLHLTCKMMYYRYAYEYTFDEYFYYNFDNIGRSSRLEFISLYERSRIFGMLCHSDTLQRFKDKYNCYLEYQDYYKRDIIKLNSPADLPVFSQFVKEHNRFIFKPNSSSCGKGVMLIDNTDNSINTMQLFKQLLTNGGGIIEEYVDQDKRMSVYHPNSVNTVRLTTFCSRDKYVILYAMLRVGRNGSTVDNANSGGITCAVDLSNGRIVSDGFCENGDVYTSHPDTGIVFKDSVLPDWTELKNMVKNMVAVIPEQKIIGWDLAYDKNKGWLVIEANSVPNITAAQMCHQKGFRSLFAETVLKEIPNGELYAEGRL